MGKMPQGILKDVDELIDEALHIEDIGRRRPHYQRKAACDRLNRRPLTSLDAGDLLDKIDKQIEKNWKTKSYPQDPSPKNWRFEVQPKIKLDNKSLEIRLQKEIIRMRHDGACLGAENWVNHVPTSSGLWNGKFNKHCAIDLVHLLSGENQYDEAEFIELKMDRKSGHPVYAAMEILLYGMLYNFSRQHLKDLNYDVTKQPLLQAKTIHLVVLAPSNYYQQYDFEWLEMKIADGLKRFVQPQGYNMDFQFQAFPSWFDPISAVTQPVRHQTIMKALGERTKGWKAIRLEETLRLEEQAGGSLAVPRSWVEKSKKKIA